jgi:polar amino acid transport system substrate-binding protein
MKKALLCGWVIVTSLFALVSHAEQDVPRQLVESASQQMTERLIADRQMVQSQDYYVEQLVDELLLPVVDHVYMSKRVLGKHWRRASKDQQKAFVAAFKQKVIRTYAGAFKAFNGEEIRFDESRLNKKGNQALLKSQIVRIGAANIRVDYKLYFKKGNWRVFDVIIEGVSLTKSFRDQVSMSIEQDGLAKAISKLADEYKSEAPQVKLGGHAWGPYLGKHLPNYGLAADIVTAAFTRVGYQVTIEFMPWSRVVEESANGELDGSIATWHTPERAESLYFSDSYVDNKLVFIKRSNDPFEFQGAVQAQQSIANKGYRLGIIDDFAYGKEFDQVKSLFNLEVREYCSQLFRDVANKNLDLALVDHWVADTELTNKKHIAEHLMRVVGTLASRSLHVTIPKSSKNGKTLIDAFNTGLARLKQDGTYQQLLEQHQFPQ